jgi:hypothetical protein
MAACDGLLIFEDPVPAASVMKTHHEMRRTVEGRKQLVDQGVSMSGYRRGQGNFYSSVPFTERRFVSWDGEGSLGDKYSLFGNSDGEHVHAPSLSTEECLTLITTGDIDAIHFGFAFTYDVNKILTDLSAGHLQILHEKGSVYWRRWRIEHRPRKWFLITDRHMGKTVKIWDVWSFFMTSAVKAWEQYGVEVSDAVIAGKALRGSQSYEEFFPQVHQYWHEENQAYVTLMDKLRASLHAAGLYISAWHGPGAIASYSMGKHHIDRAMNRQLPKPILEASQYAYGGGRFELFKVGRASVPVYEYDINSAYPYAIAQLPNLAKGRWAHNTNVGNIVRFGLYRISFSVNPFKNGHTLRAMPFLNRDHHGQISFPCVGETWVWSPELWGKKDFPGLTIHEGWEFVEDDETDRPYAWLAENYHIRKLYKAAGNQAQHALKLQMNSMYGKMAQRVGWNEEKRIAPKWHQLEWAGWVTSYCRSMVYYAALLAGNKIVAFETDAIFTTQRLADELDLGDNLGQWEETIYDDFVYLQSGCRFGLKEDGEWQAKYRGFDPGSISLDDCLNALARDPDDWYVNGKTSRFIGYAQALHQDFSQWGKFINDKDRVLHIGGEGKRRHIPRLCRACRDGIPASTGFHDCALAAPIAGMSHKHPLPWKGDQIDTSQKLADQHKSEQPSLEDT